MDADSQVVVADAPAAGAGVPPQVNATRSQSDAILDWHANEVRRMHTELNAKLKGSADGVPGPSISSPVDSATSLDLSPPACKGIVLLRDYTVKAVAEARSQCRLQHEGVKGALEDAEKLLQTLPFPALKQIREALDFLNKAEQRSDCHMKKLVKSARRSCRDLLMMHLSSKWPKGQQLQLNQSSMLRILQDVFNRKIDPELVSEFGNCVAHLKEVAARLPE